MNERQYNHYFKELPEDVSVIDVYRVLDIFEINHPCLQHAIKKLLAAGLRGQKSESQDVIEAINSLLRYLEMTKEEEGIDFEHLEIDKRSNTLQLVLPPPKIKPKAKLNLDEFRPKSVGVILPDTILPEPNAKLKPPPLPWTDAYGNIRQDEPPKGLPTKDGDVIPISSKDIGHSEA